MSTANQPNLQNLISYRVNEILDNVMKNVTDENRAQILGDEVGKIYKQGTGKTLVNLCLLSDCLRTTTAAVFVDGVLSDQERHLIYPFAKETASLFCKFRDEYKRFSELSLEDLDSFLTFYMQDEKRFGYKSDSTRWAGFGICKNIALIFDDWTPLDAYEDLAVKATMQLLSVDGLTNEEMKHFDKFREMFANVKEELRAEREARSLLEAEYPDRTEEQVDPSEPAKQVGSIICIPGGPVVVPSIQADDLLQGVAQPLTSDPISGLSQPATSNPTQDISQQPEDSIPDRSQPPHDPSSNVVAEFECPNGHPLEVEFSLVGLECQCPACGVICIVPEVEAKKQNNGIEIDNTENQAQNIFKRTDNPMDFLLNMEREERRAAGEVYCPYCQGAKVVPCNDCRGSGKLVCGNCQGTGFIEQEEPTGEYRLEACQACEGGWQQAGIGDRLWAGAMSDPTLAWDKVCSQCNGNKWVNAPLYTIVRYCCNNCSSGQRTCSTCNGSGNAFCNKCDGTGLV